MNSCRSSYRIAHFIGQGYRQDVQATAEFAAEIRDVQ